MADNETVKSVTLISPNGQQVTVAETKLAARLGAGYRLPGKSKAAKPSGQVDGGSSGDGGPASKYDDLRAADLKDAIAARNDARGDDEPQIVPDPPGNKPQLVAALVADDAAQAQ